MQREEGGNENRSLESWQFAEGGQGAQRGPTGPPRDLTLRRSLMGNQGSLQAGDGTSGRTATMAFTSTRGPPPGMGFGHITHETSPTQGSIEQGANRLPAATTGNITMWVHEPGHEGTQLTPGPLPTGMHTGTLGAGLPGEVPVHEPLPETLATLHLLGRENIPNPRPPSKEGHQDIPESGRALRIWDTPSTIPRLYAKRYNGNGTLTGKPQK
jgi:hypothetical protein